MSLSVYLEAEPTRLNSFVLDLMNGDFGNGETGPRLCEFLAHCGRAARVRFDQINEDLALRLVEPLPGPASRKTSRSLW